MSVLGAAPRGGTRGHGHIDGSEPSIPQDAFSGRVVERLRAEGIHTCEQWRQLSRRQKRSIFGVTARMVAQLDELAKQQP